MELKKKSSYRSTAKHGKRHGEATKLAVIAQLGTGKTIREVAKINGMSTATILKIKQELGSVDTINEEVNTLKKGLSRKVWRIGDMLADSIIDHPEVIDNAALSQRMVGIGIAVDKGRLMDGEPTQINEFQGLPDAELSLRLKGMLEKASRLGVRVTDIIAEMPLDYRDIDLEGLSQG
jgi:hypothetical protein